MVSLCHPACLSYLGWHNIIRIIFICVTLPKVAMACKGYKKICNLCSNFAIHFANVNKPKALLILPDFWAKVCLHLWCNYATLLALATLVHLTQIRSVLFETHCPRLPRQVGVAKISAIYAAIMP
jgi:hypothetical protein